MFDFCINGGGMVGSALALGLVRQGYRVAVVERHSPEAFDANTGPDLRLSAISIASVALLERLGAWREINTMRVRPYDTLSVWEKPDCRTDFTAASINESVLGYFVENRLIQLGCHQGITEFNQGDSESKLQWFKDTNVVEAHYNESQDLSITLGDGTNLNAHWLIGADGAQSWVRKFANIGVTGWQYGQQALGITVKMEQLTANTTWQQFCPTGPRAFLPMFDNFGSIIWYDSAQRIAQLKAMNNQQLKQAIQANFPDELGNFELLDKASFPLTRQHASAYVSGRCLIIGDAAHTINPLAGQGVNLGFKDVKVLLDITANKEDIQSSTFFKNLKQDYEQIRRRDNLAMMTAMDGFYTLFSNDVVPLKWARNALLKVAQNAGPIKEKVLRHAVGMD